MKKLAIVKLTQDKGAESYYKALKREFKDDIVLFDDSSKIFEELRGFFMENPLSEYLVLEPCDKDIKKLLLRNFGTDIERKGRYPITPTAIFRRLKEMVDLEGKTVCILNRTKRLGKPLANMLIEVGATVCVCNSKTDSIILRDMCLCSDIVITATNGRFNFVPKVEKQIVVDCSNDVKPEYCYKYTYTPSVDGRVLNIEMDAYCKYISTSQVGRWTLDELERRMEE